MQLALVDIQMRANVEIKKAVKLGLGYRNEEGRWKPYIQAVSNA